uniref:Eye transformer, isoform B n=2 Tax=Drosophila melanogaster TaxID=7227 RepID=Q9VWE1_DROME|nr:eye transformer, isoform B [Drosophila melanogaster]AAF49001.2 eye transformer, isoform B [Drosophila melanogaster]ACS12724.1 MIP10547p [Drosophila melanogaster]|eukprot:NP_608343.2 eye transformer, isoform B [Drosophila melanogaster]
MGWRTRISRLLSLTLLATLMARALAENALHMPQANCEMQSLGGPSWRSGTIGKVSCKCDGGEGRKMSVRRQGTIESTDSYNGTVVHVDANPANEWERRYECLLDGVIQSHVCVRVYALLNLKDFVCRDVVYYLRCTFSRMENGNFENKTHYQLAMGRAKPIDCRKSEDERSRGKVECSVPIDPNSRAPEWRDFRLIMSDDLGNQSKVLRLTQAEMEVLEWPRGKHNMIQTPNQTCLEWNGPFIYPNRTFELNVQFRHSKLPNLSRNLTVSQMRAVSVFDQVCFGNPPEGNQLFYVSLSRRLHGSPWSERYPEFELTTNASLPARPPRFLANGFSHDRAKRELKVYWLPLDELEFNGAEQTYVASTRTKVATTQGSMLAIFTDWDDTQPATVSVWSSNVVGRSLESSQLEVPRLSDIRDRRIYLESYNKTSSRLSWQGPEELGNFTGYIVYWCKLSSKVHDACDDSSSIETTYARETAYNFSGIQGVIRMAVAANYSDGLTTGMRWWSGDSEVPEKPKILRYVEGTIALLVLGSLVLAIQKLRQMADIRVELPVMSEEPTANPLGDVRLFYPANVPPEKFYGTVRKTVTFAEEEPTRWPEIELQEVPRPQPVPQADAYVTNQYVSMSAIGAPCGDGYIKPPPVR